jgi:hypothetical protein
MTNAPDEKAAVAELEETIEKFDFHPMVRDILLLAQTPEGQWWADQIPMDRVEQIKQLFDAAIADKSIRKGLYDVLRCAVAIYKNQPGGQRVGLHLLGLAETCIYQHKIIPLEGNTEFAPGTLEKVKEAIGKTESPNAPKVGEKRPDGALTLDSLNFPRKL